MSFEVDEFEQQRYEQAVKRAKIPAVLLLIVGILNMVLGIPFLHESITNLQLSLQDRERKAAAQWDAFPQNVKDMLKGMGGSRAQIIQMAPTTDRINLILGAVVLLAGAVTSFGAWRMLQFRSWGIALTGSILACIPVVSCMSCLLIGIIVGFWAMFALFNADVQTLFAAPEMPSEGPSQ